jgi:hypothetical protein
MRVPTPPRNRNERSDRDDDGEDDRRRPFDEEDDEPRKRWNANHRSRSRDEDDTDDDDRLTRRSRRRSLTCDCPNCDREVSPYERKEIAVEGWIVLGVLLFVFWPLCFIGLFMKSTFEVCPECGFKIRKVGSMTFG